MPKHDERRIVYGLIEGALNELERHPRIVGTFRAWDMQLGISAKARRSTRSFSTPTACREAEQAFQSAIAGQDFFDARLYVPAGAVLREIGLKAPLASLLAFGIVERFRRWAAECGGRRIDVSDPDFSPRIGRRLLLGAIPEHATTTDVRQRQRQINEILRREIARAKKAARRPGAPVPDEVAERDGRWLVIAETKRRWETLLAAEHRKTKGIQHEDGCESDRPCDDCIRHVKRRISDARRRVAAIAPQASR